MRRTDREVTSFDEITEILQRSDTIRLGLNGDPYPYVVPLSFAFEAKDEAITIYFHGAKAGLKHDLIARDAQVCVEADSFYGYDEAPGGITTRYESFIGFGKASRVYGKEAVKGLDLLLVRSGYEGHPCNTEAALAATAVYKIELTFFTGKRNASSPASPPQST